MGWVVALLLTLVASGVAAFALPTAPRNTPRQVIWDIPRVAQTFTPIVGALAGFSIASTIFIANLTVTRGAPGFPSLIGMFVIAFVIFVGAAQEFGMTPNLPPSDEPRYEQLRRIAYLLSMGGYFVALTVSWNALRILLVTLGLNSIADVFRWVLLFAVVAGTIRLSTQHLYALSSLSRSTCLAVPAIGLGAAAAFRLGLVAVVPGLAPPADEPFLVAVACFAVAALGFAYQSMLLSFHDSPLFHRRFVHGDRLVMAFQAMVGTVVGVLWIAVALV